MCDVRFIGCLHLGHKAIARYRGFQDDFYHDEHLIQEYNSVVTHRDLTYILGDITMENNKHYYQLDRLNGRKIVVMGNHDLPKHMNELLKYVESVAGMIDYKGFALTHAPIHPCEIAMYRGNIHAHIHHINKLEEVEVNKLYADNNERVLTVHKYYNVDAKLIDFRPKTINELIDG